MAATVGGKKAVKKKKGKTLSLNEFIGDSPAAFVAPTRKVDWGDESDETLGHVDLAEEYGGPPQPSIDLSKLPSAPRSSRGVDIDMSRLPSKPPYTAFLGNLPFDITEEEIRMLFTGLKVENIRFPHEQGRMKGFGYAEFYDIEELKKALSLSNEKVRARQIRIDIADQSGKDGMNRESRYGGPMDDERTQGDWRRGDETSGGGNRYGERERGGYRNEMRGGGGPADTEDCWRRDDAPKTNGHDDRGDAWRGGGRDYRVGHDDRGDAWRGGGRDSRDGHDDRGDAWRGGGRDSRDDRGSGFRDDRGSGFRDDRGSGFRDRGDGYREERGGFRDDRGGFRDDRGGYRDYRGSQRDDRDGFRDVRGGFGDDRGGFRDDRRGYRDDRDRGFRDDRGVVRDDRRDGYRDSRPTDSSSSDVLRERPKLNLKARSVDAKPSTEVTLASSSIFGGARPVDTASKERQIEEKLSKFHVSDKPRGGDQKVRSRDNSHDEMLKSEEKTETDDTDNWRNDGSRQDRGRVMRPGFANEKRETRKSDSDDLSVLKKDDNRERNAGRGSQGRGRSPKDRKHKDGPIVLPKYEEPAKPEFSKSSKFAALDVEDGKSDSDGEDTDQT